MIRSGAAVCAAALALAGTAAAAAQTSFLDARLPPWVAVAKIHTGAGARCSGVLVGPAHVVTAAHCLYNRRTGRMLQPDSLHVLFGWDRGAYLRHVRIRTYRLSPAYDPRRPRDSAAADWAVLELSAPVPDIPPLPLAGAVSAGPAGLAGYRQDKAQVLTGDLGCAITGRLGGMLLHDCANIAGLSGGPLLVRSASGWTVAGVNVAMTEAGGLAVAVEQFAAAVRPAEGAAPP